MLVTIPCFRRGTILMLLCLSTALLQSAAQAAPASEAPELETDRPDFTESSLVVPQGSLQLESGFTYERGGGLRTFGGPELLLRWGVSRKTEVRIGSPSYFQVRSRQRISGFGGTYVGLKQQLGPLRGGWEAALIPAVTLPTGSRELGGKSVEPELKAVWARALGGPWSLSGMFAFYWPEGVRDRNFTFQPTISLGRALGERWGAFLEYAGQLPEQGGDAHLIHHGYTYSPSRLTQIDLHFGFGLTRAAPDFFIGAGYSVRF